MPPIDSSRRAFLRGDIRATPKTRRIPWAVEAFTELCQRCDECITACEEKILVRGDGGFPDIDFKLGGCTFCGACARACKHGAIYDTGLPAWNLKAGIGATCLEAQGITCRACGEACDARAIRFFPRVGGGAELRLNQDICTGCGACLAVCPVNAVNISAAPTKSVSAPSAAETNQLEERA